MRDLLQSDSDIFIRARVEDQWKEEAFEWDIEAENQNENGLNDAKPIAKMEQIINGSNNRRENEQQTQYAKVHRCQILH